MGLTHIPDTNLVRIDFVFLGAQWLQTHALQARLAFSQLKEGTQQYSSETLARRLDYYGATLSTSCNLSYSAVTIHCLHRHLPSVIPYIASMFAEPLYPDAQLQIALSQGRTAWQIQHQKVDALCKEGLYRQLFGTQHPMGRFPTLADYATITPQHLHDYHERCISPAFMVPLVTGCFDDTDLLLIERLFGVKAGTRPSAFAFEPKPIRTSDERHAHIHTGEEERLQAGVRFGRLLPPATHPDMPLLRLAVMVLGGYFGSRLMTEIRERQGLTYGINATVYNIPNDNALVIATETATQHVERLQRQVLAELQRLCDEPVPEDELQMVKQYLYGQNCRRYEHNFNYPQVLMSLLATGRSVEDLDREQQLQLQATPEQLLDICQRYFRPEDFMSCVVD